MKLLKMVRGCFIGSEPPWSATRPGVELKIVSFLSILVAFTVVCSTYVGKTCPSVFLPSVSLLSVWPHGKQQSFSQPKTVEFPHGTNSDMVHAAFVWITGITSPPTDVETLAVFLLHALRSSEYCVYIQLLFTFVLSPAQEFLTHEGYFVPDTGSSVGRGDVARFMLSLLSSNAWVKKGVAMTTK